jgi:hypothetical protein
LHKTLMYRALTDAMVGYQQEVLDSYFDWVVAQRGAAEQFRSDVVSYIHSHGHALATLRRLYDQAQHTSFIPALQSLRAGATRPLEVLIADGDVLRAELYARPARASMQ